MSYIISDYLDRTTSNTWEMSGDSVLMAEQELFLNIQMIRSDCKNTNFS